MSCFVLNSIVKYFNSTFFNGPLEELSLSSRWAPFAKCRIDANALFGYTLGSTLRYAPLYRTRFQPDIFYSPLKLRLLSYIQVSPLLGATFMVKNVLKDSGRILDLEKMDFELNPEKKISITYSIEKNMGIINRNCILVGRHFYCSCL